MGLCPLCLLSPRPTSDPPSGSRRPSEHEIFGEYELVKEMGSGGEGVVYKARRTGTRRTVALKRIADEATEDEVSRFRTAAEEMRKLKHRNIVPVDNVGEHEGRPYFTMKLMTGGSLADHLARLRGDLRGAAELVATIAMAVHYAHQSGILHRDLKPANILFDEKGQPHVADFGVATRIDRTSRLTKTGMVVGTLGYMAPEQAYGPTKSLTAAADIYSLGVILYELTTLPRNPMASGGRVDHDLATICLTCLEKDPEHRYGSAEELALDLRRYLKGERPSRAERAWRWCLRHPVPAGLILAAASFLVIMTSSAVSLAREQEAAKRAQITQVNMNSAAMVAGTVLSQFRAFSDAVERTAAKDDLARALQNGDDAAVQAFCESTYKLYEDPSHGLKLNGNSPFTIWHVLDEDGVAKGVYPTPTTIGKGFAWRDYFEGAWQLADKGLRSTYVSRAFKSENDGKYNFSISAPIYGSDRRPIGVLTAGVVTAASLGSLVVHDTQSVTVLAAPRDRERDAPLPESTHLILLHPDYMNGEATPIEDERVRTLDEDSRISTLRIERPLWLPSPALVTSSDDYEDPVAKKYPQYAGRWLAGFAPVGNTGFVVIVQTRADEALGPEKKLAKQLAKWAGIAGGIDVLLMLVVAWYRRRRRAGCRTAAAEQ